MSRNRRTKAAPPADNDAITDGQIQAAMGSVEPIMDPLVELVASTAKYFDLAEDSPERSVEADKLEANFTKLWAALTQFGVGCVRAAIELSDDLESAEIAQKRASAEANYAIAEYFRKGP